MIELFGVDHVVGFGVHDGEVESSVGEFFGFGDEELVDELSSSPGVGNPSGVNVVELLESP